MERKSNLTIVVAIAVLAVLGATIIYAQDHAQDKYSLKSPSGIAFSDFKGYEDWSVVSSARTDEVLKVIVANPTMIKAYRDFRRPADGDTRCSTTKPHRTSSRPIPKASQTADTRAMWP